MTDQIEPKKPARRSASARRRAAGARAEHAATGTPYTAALRVPGELREQPEPGRRVRQLSAAFVEINADLKALFAEAGEGEPDPLRMQALLEDRALIWGQLGQGRDDVYGTACAYAAILDQQQAAQIRYQHRIPTLFPGTQNAHLNLADKRCDFCGRPWQLSAKGACPHCPATVHGLADTWQNPEHDRSSQE